MRFIPVWTNYVFPFGEAKEPPAVEDRIQLEPAAGDVVWVNGADVWVISAVASFGFMRGSRIETRHERFYFSPLTPNELANALNAPA